MHKFLSFSLKSVTASVISALLMQTSALSAEEALAPQTVKENADNGGKSSCQLPEASLFNAENKAIPQGERVLSFDYSNEISESKTQLSGKVTLRNSQSTLVADQLLIDNQTNRLEAKGDVQIESETTRFSIDSLIQDGESQQMTMENGEFSLKESGAQGSADQIQVRVDKPTELNNLTYSTCAKGNEDWQLSMESLSLNHLTGRGEARDTTFRVADVPVFFLPYLTFPIDSRRQSGLLFPAFENDNKNGIDYTQPIYWNIAPWIDMTFYPRWIEKRGAQFGTELRWLTEHSQSQWNLEYLDKDDVIASQAVDLNNADLKRWKSEFSHLANFNEHWKLNVETSRVSDSDYFRDFGSGLESSNKTFLESRAHLSYADSIWDIDLYAEADQSLIGQGIYRLLPSLRVKADKSFHGVELEFDSEWTEFDHPELNEIVGSRRHIAPSISYPLENAWGRLVPKMGYWSTDYQLENQATGQETDISRELGVFSLDASMALEKTYRWNKQAITHQISPRFFYVNIPYESQQDVHLFDTLIPQFGFQQLWRENRFVGIDRVGDTNHLSVAVANSLFEDDSGNRLAYLNIGRRVYFEDRNIDLYNDRLQVNGSSPWIAELDWQISDSLSVSQFIEWQQDARHTNQAFTRIKFEPQANHIVNLTHRYRDIGNNQVEESDLSFAWPINSQWRFVGRWYNDNFRDQIIESMAGLEYESCCWAMRIVAQEYLNTQLDSNGLPIIGGNDEYTSGVYFQFIFKGLGSAGKSSLGRILEDGIRGYRDEFGRN